MVAGGPDPEAGATGHQASGSGDEAGPAPEALEEQAPAPEVLEGQEAGSQAEDDPAEDLKAKYREALAHKHGSSGAQHSEHGDKGESVHSQNTGPTHRMFRRRAGG